MAWELAVNNDGRGERLLWLSCMVLCCSASEVEAKAKRAATRCLRAKDAWRAGVCGIVLRSRRCCKSSGSVKKGDSRCVLEISVSISLGRNPTAQVSGKA